MRVNRLQLPAALIEIILDAGGEITQWMLKEPDLRKQVTPYGEERDLGDFMILDSDRMVEETAKLPGRFITLSEEQYQRRDENEPGAIPNIHDYSQIVVFGEDGTGAPFCLDYR